MDDRISLSCFGKGIEDRIYSYKRIKYFNTERCHCEPEGRGNLTPSLPSPLEGEGEGGGDCFVAQLLAMTLCLMRLYSLVNLGKGEWHGTSCRKRGNT
jgi:hypothetical protein